MNLMPAARATASVPPPWLPHRALDGARRQVTRSDLSRVGRESLELDFRQADADLAVDDADRRGHCPCGADAAFALEADGDAVGGGKPCATSVVSSATTARRSASAVATSSASLITARALAALLTARPRPARRTVPPRRAQRRGHRRASRRPARRRRPSSRRPGRPAVRTARRRRTAAVGTALEDPGRAGAKRPPTIRSSTSLQKTASGPSSSSERRNASAEVRIALQEGEVDADACALGARASSAPVRRRNESARAQRVAREVKPRAAREPAVFDLGWPERGRDAAIGRHRPLAVGRDERDDHPVACRHDGGR